MKKIRPIKKAVIVRILNWNTFVLLRTSCQALRKKKMQVQRNRSPNHYALQCSPARVKDDDMLRAANHFFFFSHVFPWSVARIKRGKISRYNNVRFFTTPYALRCYILYTCSLPRLACVRCFAGKICIVLRIVIVLRVRLEEPFVHHRQKINDFSHSSVTTLKTIVPGTWHFQRLSNMD